jgi:hypothetical protein
MSLVETYRNIPVILIDMVGFTGYVGGKFDESTVLREQAGEQAFALVEGLRQTLVERRRTGADTADVAIQLAALSSLELEVLMLVVKMVKMLKILQPLNLEPLWGNM